jgi:fermentation-respiration switch protein FrsA (DUF1100 family)
MEKVNFKNGGMKIAGNLYLPKDFNSKSKYPAIVYIHPGGGVKEQTVGLYASKMALRGFIGLTFDATHQGESEGIPRFLENPTARDEDARCAVDYLTTLSCVNLENIGVLGICSGGGYAISVAQTERRIKAVVGISAVNIGDAYRLGWDGSLSTEHQLSTLEEVVKQRTAEANGAEPRYFGYVPDEIDENTPISMLEGYDYYRTPRAQHPNSTNRCLFTSFDKLMAYDAFTNIGTLLTQPLLLFAGSKADSTWHSERAMREAAGPKELVTIEGASHVDLYDISEYVDPIIEKLDRFYTQSFRSNSTI